MKTPPKRRKAADSTIAAEILSGLKDFEATLDEGTLDEPLNCRHVILDLRPGSYSSARVRGTREILEVSQPLFAKFLGVSIQTVRHWEQGINAPSLIACRFMDEIRLDPEHYRKRLRNAVRIKE